MCHNFVCSIKAALVGGMASYCRCFWANISKRALFTESVVVVLSYMMATQFHVQITTDSRCFAQMIKHICLIIKYFPCLACCSLTFPTKDQNSVTTSKRMYNGKHNAGGPKESDTPWLDTHLKSLALPNAIHNLSFSSLSNIEIARTTTSMSVLITKDLFNSWTAACFTWTNIHVSSYSLLQGQKSDRSILLLQRTFSMCKTTQFR